MKYHKIKLSFGWVYIRVQGDKWQCWHPNLDGWAGSKGLIEEHQGFKVSHVIKGIWSEDFSGNVLLRSVRVIEVTQLEVLVVLGSKAVEDQ